MKFKFNIRTPLRDYLNKDSLLTGFEISHIAFNVSNGNSFDIDGDELEVFETNDGLVIRAEKDCPYIIPNLSLACIRVYRYDSDEDICFCKLEEDPELFEKPLVDPMFCVSSYILRDDRGITRRRYIDPNGEEREEEA